MRRIVSIFAAAVLAVSLVFTAGMVSAMAAEAPEIDSVEYKGAGRVCVEFLDDVDYGNSRVTVYDSSGRGYRTRMMLRDSDGLTFIILGYKTGKKYQFTVSGIKIRGTSRFMSVRGSVKIPSAMSVSKISIKEIEYNARKAELDVEFAHRVQWNRPSAVIYDSIGRKYAARITDKDGDDCEISVIGLTSGKRYTLRLTGVKKRGTGAFTTVCRSFSA